MNISPPPRAPKGRVLDAALFLGLFAGYACAAEEGPDPRAADFTMGQTAVFTAADQGNGQLLLGQKTPLSQNGSVRSLSFYVTAASGQMYLALYTDNAGKPDALIVSSALFTPSCPTLPCWVTQPVTATDLVAGTYWLVFHPSSNSLVSVKGSSGGAVYRSETFGPPPAAFGPQTGSTSAQWSFYATLSSGTPTPTPIDGVPSAPSISTGQFGTMDFAWDAPASGAVAGYRFYLGKGSSNCPSADYVYVQRLDLTYPHLEWGATYVAQVTAIGTDGTQSACSNTATGTPK